MRRNTADKLKRSRRPICVDTDSSSFLSLLAQVSRSEKHPLCFPERSLAVTYGYPLPPHPLFANIFYSLKPVSVLATEDLSYLPVTFVLPLDVIIIHFTQRGSNFPETSQLVPGVILTPLPGLAMAPWDS